MPEVASRRHTELVNEVVAEAHDRGRRRLGRPRRASPSRRARASSAPCWSASRRPRRSPTARRLPLIPVNHLQGHIAANYALGVEAPFVCLVASGGHTLLAVVEEGVEFRVVGAHASTTPPARPSTRAPGCSASATRAARSWTSWRRAATRASRAFRAPCRGAVDFSFSGLKTALLYDLREQRRGGRSSAQRADIAASYQAAIVGQLVEQDLGCAAAEGLRRVAVAGGVAANSGCAARSPTPARQRACGSSLPPLSLCTDNAGMVGLAAGFCRPIPWPEYLGLDAFARRRWASDGGRGA